MAMAIEFEELARDALRESAGLMGAAARTAPKARGVDNLIVKILTADERGRLAAKMREIGEKESHPYYVRDAGSVERCEYILVIGTKKMSLGLNCGYCGYPTCEALTETDGVCAFNSLDLGIALGSAAATAAALHVDNRLMITVGRSAIQCGFLGEGAIQAIGIPLSATGKNPFFDRTK
jgi:uncharacterized ferredoxin-like protein